MNNRNMPCPCGSGLKFKKCCLPRMDAQKFAQRQTENLEWDKWFDQDLALGQAYLAAAEKELSERLEKEKEKKD